MPISHSYRLIVAGAFWLCQAAGFGGCNQPSGVLLSVQHTDARFKKVGFDLDVPSLGKRSFVFDLKQPASTDPDNLAAPQTFGIKLPQNTVGRVTVTAKPLTEDGNPIVRCGQLLSTEGSAELEAPYTRIEIPLNYSTEDKTEVVSPYGISESLYSMWASSLNNLWVGGNSGLIARFDGSRWSRYKVTQSLSSAYYAIYGLSANDMLVASVVDSKAPVSQVKSQLFSWDGACWSQVSASEQINGQITAMAALDGTYWLIGTDNAMRPMMYVVKKNSQQIYEIAERYRDAELGSKISTTAFTAATGTLLSIVAQKATTGPDTVLYLGVSDSATSKSYVIWGNPASGLLSTRSELPMKPTQMAGTATGGLWIAGPGGGGINYALYTTLPAGTGLDNRIAALPSGTGIIYDSIAYFPYNGDNIALVAAANNPPTIMRCTLDTVMPNKTTCMQQTGLNSTVLNKGITSSWAFTDEVVFTGYDGLRVRYRPVPSGFEALP